MTLACSRTNLKRKVRLTSEVQHIVYIPKDAPAGYAASACFPYLPKSATAASSEFREGARRVRVTITVEEIE